MNRSASPAASERKLTARASRWTKRRTGTLLLAVGISGPSIYFVWMLFGWPAAIVISRETTHWTEPLTTDGAYVDYGAVFLNQAAWMKERKAEDDLWRRMMFPGTNRPGGRPQVDVEYVEPEVRLYESPPASKEEADARDSRLSARMNAPFSDADDPQFAEAVHRNEEWYAAISAIDPGAPAVELPVSLDGSSNVLISSIGLPLVSVHQELIRRFNLRAMLSFGNGEPEKGLASVDFIMAVAEREQQVPSVLNYVVAVRIDSMAHDALWNGVLSLRDAPDPVLKRVLGLRMDEGFLKSLGSRLDESERMYHLERLQNAHRSRCADAQLASFYGTCAGWKPQWFCQRVDWNDVMRFNNQSFDEIVAGFRISGYRQRTEVLNAILAKRRTQLTTGLVDDVESWESLLTADVTAYVKNNCLDEIVYLTTLSEPVYDNLNRRRRTQLAARLVVFHQLHGSYPESLESLLEVPGLPVLSNNVITDAFSEEPFQYRREGKGFLLWSVGPNMIEDSSGDEGIGDDLVWRWPPQLSPISSASP